MQARFRALWRNPFLRNNAIFFIGSIAVGALNYLYYPVLGRVLSTAAFGELQVLVSLTTQAAILLQVFSLVATNIIVNESDTKRLNAILSELQKLSLWLAGGLLALTLLAAGWLQAALQFGSPWPFVVVGLIFLASLPPTYTGAYLRARQAFGAASISGAVGALAKLVFSVLLVLAGWAALGAAVGMLLAQLCVLAYTLYKARQLGYRLVRTGSVKPNWALVRPHYKFAGFVLVSSLIVTGLVTVDSIAVKYWLTPDEAGLYGGISTIARIIFFLTGSVGLVLLTSVKLSQPPRQNIDLLVRSFGLTLALGGSALALFSLFPVPVLHWLLGERYDAYAQYLPWLATAILALSLSQLLAQYHIALRHYFVVVPLLLGAVVTAGLLGLRHASVADIVGAILAGSLVLLAGLLAWSLFRGRSLLTKINEA